MPAILLPVTPCPAVWHVTRLYCVMMTCWSDYTHFSYLGWSRLIVLPFPAALYDRNVNVTVIHRKGDPAFVTQWSRLVTWRHLRIIAACKCWLIQFLKWRVTLKLHTETSGHTVCHSWWHGSSAVTNGACHCFWHPRRMTQWQTVTNCPCWSRFATKRQTPFVTLTSQRDLMLTYYQGFFFTRAGGGEGMQFWRTEKTKILLRSIIFVGNI